MYNGEILTDTSKSGKKRPWRNKKLASLTYADYLEVLNFKKAHRVKECGDVLNFAVTPDGLKLYQTWFCKSRLCPLCSWRRSIKNSYEVKLVLNQALKEEPHAIFLFLTLTEENSKLGDLRNNLRNMNRSIYRLFKYKDVARDLLGYVRSTEITVNREKMTFHQHLHILLMMRSSYLNRGHYLTNKDWSGYWKKARRLDYMPVINVKKVRASKKDNSLVASAKEVAKYQLKDSDYITNENGSINSNTRKTDLIILNELEHSLAGMRQLSFGGILKQVRHDLLLDQKEDDLINFSDDTDGENILKTVMYKWNSNVKNYVGWENS